MAKIIIDVSGGIVQAVHCPTGEFIEYVVVDWDNINVGESPVLESMEADTQGMPGGMIYSDGSPAETEIADELKRLHY